MGEAKRRIEQLVQRFAELGMDPSLSKSPTREDARAALAVLKEPLALAGITDEQDVAGGLSMMMSAVIGLRPDEIPPLRFKEPGAANKKQAVERIAQALIDGR
jgi:hypothetical protein